ncbi:unnamed protein product [Rotaria sordida]|uniref:Uncharacterized protein n=1 Tax=Rotaria sordida TaxID=392033 RepID=A0A813TXG5_9BILA|nr:unnamed protein product [Rotaria sordida]CAF0819802.1 unnamed protein product [Rotaria sordida]
MTKSNIIRTRNVEDIRRKNVEDNQVFLKMLCITNIRNDFLHTARSILQKQKNTKIPIEHKKNEYPTRYNSKIKSGEISPHVPEWQRQIQNKLLKKERKQQEKQMKQQERLRKQELKKEMLKLKRKKHLRRSKWTLFYKNNVNPYQRIFKPRNIKKDERIQQETIESSK